jgi:hypothetical protein
MDRTWLGALHRLIRSGLKNELGFVNGSYGCGHEEKNVLIERNCMFVELRVNADD